jgi:uncharacterized coiled-coil protein SlyX
VNEIQAELERRLQHLEEALQRQDNAIIELKALLTRAADALASCNLTMQEEYDLIAELRKAAK